VAAAATNPRKTTHKFLFLVGAIRSRSVKIISMWQCRKAAIRIKSLVIDTKWSVSLETNTNIPPEPLALT